MSRQGRESGQVLIVMAVLAVVLFGLASIALDTGVAAADRRDLQSYSDAAALAGAEEYNLGGTSTDAHYVAILYVKKSIGASSLPSGCTSSSCPAGTYTFTGGYTITLSDPGGTSLDVGMKHSQNSFLAGVIGFKTDVDASSGRAEPVTPGQIAAIYSVVAMGTGADVHINGGGVGSNPTGDVGGPVYANGSYGANNNPHSTQVSSYITGYGGTTSGSGTSICDSPSQTNYIDIGDSGDSLSYDFTGAAGTLNTSKTTPPSASASFMADAPTTTGSTFTTTAAAKDASGYWKPGTYNGIAPNGGTLNAGVYVIKNYTGTITPGHNLTNPGRGQEDTAGAISLVLDASDTGSLDLNSAQLNGLDDLNPSNYSGTRDPLGTHNFVIWGGTFAGSLADFQPHDTTDITGIVFLPNQDMVEHGSASPLFAGSLWTNSITIDGGGNGTQIFAWVCGLRAINPSPAGGGLVR